MIEKIQKMMRPALSSELLADGLGKVGQSVQPRKSYCSYLGALSSHEKALRSFLKSDVVYDGPEIFDHPLYCLGFSNRSGSNLLAEYLTATPYFSGFQERLNFKTVKSLSTKWGIDSFPDYFQETNARLGKDQFVCGFKASAGQLMMLQRYGIPRMYKGGMRIIHITRNDLVGQAVSFQIASQTKQWNSKQAAVAGDKTVHFDAKQITRMIDAAQASANGIAMFAEIFGYPRIHVTYEELVEAPEKVLRQIAQFSGQQAADWPVAKPSLKRQASEVNELLRKQYLESIRQSLL